MIKHFACLLGFVMLLSGCSSPPQVPVKEAAFTAPVVLDKMQYPREESAQIERTLKRGAVEKLALPEVDLKSASKVGIIVPHHLVAADAIQMAIEAVGAFEPEVIVLLAPNHKPSSSKPIITRGTTFEALGQVYTISPIVDSLLSEQFAVASRHRFLSEHGLYSILPFVSTAFDVPLIPLVFAPGIDRQRIDALHEKMDPLLSPLKVLWIASVDFSHYLPAVASAKKDQETMQWIADRNFEALYTASNAYFDSPEVMRLWLMQFENTKLLWHSNSALVTGSGFNEEGTSYMVYLGY